MFNYNLFKTIYDTSNTLKSVVDDFNQETIVLKTEKQAEKDKTDKFLISKKNIFKIVDKKILARPIFEKIVILLFQKLPKIFKNPKNSFFPQNWKKSRK